MESQPMESSGNEKVASDITAPRENIENGVEKTPQAAVYIEGFPLLAVVSALTLVCFLMLLDTSILSTATPKITSDFHSTSNVGWYGASYQLASAALLPLTGKIYSNFSTKWTFFSFFLVFELGSLLCAVSTSSNMLIVARAVAGMGSSGMMNGAMTIVAGCAPMPKRPMLLGVIIGVAQLGLVAGPLFGGLFTEYVSWRWCFYINLPIGALVAVVLGLIRIPEQISKLPPTTIVRSLHHKLDLIGFTLFAPWTVMLLLAVQYGGNQYAWNSPVVIGLLCGAATMAGIWMFWNYRQKENAMLPWPMLKVRYVWTSCLVYAFLANFQGVRGKGAALSGVFLLPGIISQLVASIISGKLVGTFGYYMPWSIISSILTAIGYGLLSTLTSHTSAGKWIGYQIVAGAGRGFGLQMPIIAVQNTLSPAQIPTAMSLVIFSQTFGAGVFLSFADTIFTNRLRSILEAGVPQIDAQSVIAAGLYNVRAAVPTEYVAAVLRAYSVSINSVFYLCAALAAACFGLAFGMGWVDIRAKKTGEEATVP